MNRVWIYLSEKEFTDEQIKEISAEGEHFLSGWNAHGQPLSGTLEVYKKHFIIIKANEAQFAASGCSIDKLVQFIKHTEQKFNLSLFNRLLVAVQKDEGIEVIHSSKVRGLLDNGSLNENSLVYELSVGTEKELLQNFLVPLKNSWLKKFLSHTKI
jgi:hypothetical protein